MSRDSAKDLLDALDLEFFLERESLPFRIGRGRSGAQLNVMTCPDCGDGRYRVYLNAETGLGNCFVCNEPLNKFKFVHKHLGHTEHQKAKTFAYIKEVLADQGWRPRRPVEVAVEAASVALPLSIALPTEDGRTLDYLRDRGIDDDLTRYFHLRYCEEGWWNYTKADGSPGGQNFKGRVVIPVYDLDGTLVTFQGRDVTGKADPKYLFPSGLPGTGRFLYNGHNARLARRVVMGEGAFDVYGLKIACDAAPDLRDMVAVGSFGKNLSFGDLVGNDQLGRFLRLRDLGLREVTICWDGEPKALTAALDAARLLIGIGLQVRIALMPAGKDPNEVPAGVTQKALREAKLYSPTLDLQWRVKNPYAAQTQRQSILSACP